MKNKAEIDKILDSVCVSDSQALKAAWVNICELTKPLVNIHIVCAASKMSNGLVIASPRHWDNVSRPIAQELSSKISHDQGFVCRFGIYWDRVQALKIVLMNGQDFDVDRNGSSDELYSEGLY